MPKSKAQRQAGAFSRLWQQWRNGFRQMGRITTYRTSDETVLLLLANKFALNGVKCSMEDGSVHVSSGTVFIPWDKRDSGKNEHLRQVASEVANG